ncbi:hypothetical protein [Paucidesulfovibrio longus]|uniref:hypothetical protein n=1 Tax=Paucidesulfovibrio longus TaxID=889 RepID=UPI0003B41779|nr:hypothetical protein [Paucidesulfovibrio longus]
MRGIMTFLGSVVVGILAVTGVNAVTVEKRRCLSDPEVALEVMEGVEEGERESNEAHDHEDRGGLIIR